MSWIEDPGVENFGSYVLNELDIDQAYLNVSSGSNQKLWLYSLSSNCHTCPYQRVTEANATVSSSGDVYKVPTSYSVKYRFRTSGVYPTIHYDQEDKENYCDVGPLNFGEFGIYELRATKVPGKLSCFEFNEVRSPVNIYYPFLIAFLFYLVLALLINLYKFLFNRRDSSSTSSTSTSSTSSQVPVVSPPLHPSSFPTTNGNLSINPTGGGGDPGLPSGLMQTKAASLSASRTSIVSHRSQRSSMGSVSGHPHLGLHQGPPSDYGSYMGGEAPYKPYVGIVPSTANSDYSQGVAAAATRRSSATMTTTTSPSQPEPSSPSRQLQRQRLQSLDTFRGICIVVMIFVNDGGAHYYFLEHAAWDGLYVADLVFPWFLWIMGVCIPFSIKSQRKRNTPTLKIFGKILIRSLKLIGIGLVLASLWGPVDLVNLRIPGVLQRFGVCYFVCSTLVLFYMNVNFTKPGTQSKFSKLQGALQDVEIIWIGWLAILLFVVAHCMLTFFLQVPGCPTGYLGPGGLHDNGAWSSLCIGGASGFIDRKIFTEKHIYGNPTANSVYAEGMGRPFDPEGALGTFTSLLQVWCGVQTGVTMTVYPKATSRIKRWLIWALLLGAAGTLLCGGKQTGGWIPINKNLWSLSFVLVTSSFALILLSFLYFVIDIMKWWSGTPFYEPGMNSILLYVGHSVGNCCLPWHWRVGLMRTHTMHLFESLWGTTLWVIIAIWLNYKKIFWVL